MDEPLSPTPYADVNSVLQELLERMRVILGDQLVSLYLYGSLALGDFDPRSSDIDFIVVTREEIAEEQFAALREMHARFDQSDSAWAGKIEAAYIPQEALNHPAGTLARYPQIEKGTQLVRMPLEEGWAFQRLTLREQGVSLSGPPPRSLIEPVEPGEIWQAAASILGGWHRQALEDPSWMPWARKRSGQAFIVLTVCRMLYSLETGAVASKPAAARWAKASLGRRWESLIDEALSSPHDEEDVPDAVLNETLAFLQESVRGL